MAKRKNGEGSYGEKTINGHKYKFFRDPKGRYVYAKTMKELKEKMKTLDEKPVLTPESKLYVFSDYCFDWLHGRYKKVSDRTYDDYENIINNRIVKFKGYDIANKQLKSLIPQMFTDYFDALSAKYAKSTIDKCWILVQQVLKYGMRNEDIPRFDLSEIERPSEHKVAVKKKTIPIISESDMEILWDEAHNGLYGCTALAVCFIMYSGLRISELVALKWENVSKDFTSITIAQATSRVVKRDEKMNPILNEDGTIAHEVITKSPKSDSGNRVIPIPDRGQEILKYFNDNFNHTSKSNVFVTDKGTQMDRANVGRTLRKMMKNSDCYRKDYTLHGLRHGYGSIMISKGVDIKIVSELLGHSNVAFTYQVYIGILKDDKIKAVNDVFNKTVH